MIDFVTRGNEILVLRDNIPYHQFNKQDMMEEHSLYLISMLNSEARRTDDTELSPTEEEEFLDLQDFVIKLAKNQL
jgi:hypothetical protein